MRSGLAFLSALALVGAAGAAIFVAGDPCLWRCGAQTECKERRCVVKATSAPSAAAVAPASKRSRRRPTSSSGGAEPAAPEVQLKPGDEKMVTSGDALGKSERIDFAQPDAKELSQDQIDETFAKLSPGIERCIATAVGDAPLERARIVVGVRIEASGQASRVRTEAPSILQQHGLHACIKSALRAHPFPPSGGGSVVTYPFELK